MKEYKVFEHSNGKIEAVKQGWSWPGFFFTVFWLFVKQCWLIGISIIAFFIIIAFVGNYVGGAIKTTMDIVMNIANVFVVVMLWTNGNKLREKNLLSRGFDFKTTVTAANPDEAVELYSREKQ